ncbi:outer membrane protein [Oceanisphaera marina]|uniref:Outer membrane protein n=1 Tax=Oceanisphaera marina TaxID=2017550 RepID=A0ABQ1IV37_9GAMM|nr:porin [Oceanisphaera marina]GGB51238.1 outer membrane protein [Oceanisphaera marina]
MKKTILALTIPALFATSASAVTVYSDEGAQVDIYGRVQYEAGEIGHQGDFGQAGAGEAENFGGDGEARLGVNVKYMLNQDVDLIGKLEWQVAGESSANGQFDSRYAWAGFRFVDTTELTFGRSMDPYAQALYYTDILNIYGGTAAYGGAIGDVTKALGYKAAINDKVDDQVLLTYAANGLDLRAGYAFADDRKNDSTKENKDNQWSVSAGYTAPFGLGVVAAYEEQQFGNFGFAGQDDYQLDAWIAGLNYSIDGFYFAALYTEQEMDNNTNNIETEGYELHAQYSVDAWTLLAQYSKEDANLNGFEWDSIDTITLGGQYALTPKAKLYAEYVISDSETLDNNGLVTKDDVFGMGIQYNF